jgi:RsiW-degrading membrane proteinase PrsW (M82 family)
LAVAVAVISALLPGFLWLRVFTKGRSYRGAPLKILLITFLLGMASVIPAGFIEFLLIDSDELEYGLASFGTVVVAMFFIVGPVEETSKFLAVRLGVYRTRHLREPLDGLIYGAAASLGFATAENIGYALLFGPELMIVRGPVSTLGHVVFGSLWALSLNPQAPPGRRKIVGITALAAAALLHGLFNVLLFSFWGIVPAFLLVGVGGYVVIRMFRRAKSNSTYHLRRNVPLLKCTICSSDYHQQDNFCPECGTSTSLLTPKEWHCANCGQVSETDAKFCIACGDLFVLDA